MNTTSINSMTDDFRSTILRNAGIIGAKEQETLWEIAKRCSRIGVVAGAGVGAKGAMAGSIVLPGIGTVSTGAAAFLAGFAYGTGACVAINATLKEELRKLASQPMH